MDKKLKAKWMKALRSGEYEQGRDYLHNRKEGTFCCLGVLREIQEPGAEYEKEGTGILAPKHRDGLDEETMCKLANDMNDQGWSFKTIADWIEKNL